MHTDIRQGDSASRSRNAKNHVDDRCDKHATDNGYVHMYNTNNNNIPRRNDNYKRSMVTAIATHGVS
jgi:hypothetical protein